MVSQLVWYGYTWPDDFVMTWSLADMRETANNCAELIEKTANVLDDDTLKLLFVSVQENNINLCICSAVKQWVTCSLIRDHLLISLPSRFIERWKCQKGKVRLILWIWLMWYTMEKDLDDTTLLRQLVVHILAWFPHVWVGDATVLSRQTPSWQHTGQIGKINAGGTHLHTLLNMPCKCWLETWCLMSRMWVFDSFSNYRKADW